MDGKYLVIFIIALISGLLQAKEPATHRKCADSLRHVAENTVDAAEPVSQNLSPEDVLDLKRAPQRIASLFEKADLTPQQTRYLVMFFGLPMTYVDRKGLPRTNHDEVDLTLQEIAEVEGVNSLLVHETVTEALNKLRKVVTKQDHERAYH